METALDRAIKNNKAISFERTLISQDIKLFETITQSDFWKYTAKLEAIKTAFEGLEIGPFTSDVFAEIINRGISQIIKRFDASLEEQLDTLGIKNDMIRKNLVNGNVEKTQAFENAVRDLNSVVINPEYTRFILPLNYIVFENGDFKVSEENKDLIMKDHCSFYLENEAQHQVYLKLQTVTSTINSLLPDMMKMLPMMNSGTMQNKAINMLNELTKRNEDFTLSMNNKNIQYCFKRLEK